MAAHPLPDRTCHLATQGWVTDVPGLVVLFRGWRIQLVHIDSDRTLADFPTVDAARGAAVSLGDLADWTAPLDEIEPHQLLDELLAGVHAYRGGDVEPVGELDEFDITVARPHDALPPTDRETRLATPAWTLGVDGLAAVWIAHELHVVHLHSGRSIGTAYTLDAARSAAPWMLHLITPLSWTAPFGRLAAGGPSLWNAVAALLRAAHADAYELRTPDDPDHRALTLRPAWSTPYQDLAVTLAPEGLVLVEALSGERLGDPYSSIGAARAGAGCLHKTLADIGWTPADVVARWRDREGIDVPLGPGNLRV